MIQQLAWQTRAGGGEEWGKKENGKKKLRDRKRQSGPDSLELPALRESQIQPSEWVCVGVNVCVRTSGVFVCVYWDLYKNMHNHPVSCTPMTLRVGCSKRDGNKNKKSEIKKSSFYKNRQKASQVILDGT